MKYRKPQLNVVGTAITAVRQTCSEKGLGNIDNKGCVGNKHNTAAAYEADE